jgi:D-cysteine desulfhydrase family pyridoxal phosphate-dependent enzyme
MRLASLPRTRLAHLPTPLEEAPFLSAALGGPRIFIKRDDCTGLALGGNKTRKLEYLIADAQSKGASVVITCGSDRSNHCRQTAAAARVAGMKCVLVLNSATAEPPVQGNLLLDRMLGAQVRFVGSEAERDPMMEEVAHEFRERGEEPYIIANGGSDPVGAAGYVAAVFELMEQLNELGIEPARLYTTSSLSGGTHAGLAIGAVITGATFQVHGIAIEGNEDEVRDVVLPLANATAQYLESDAHLDPDDLHIDANYVGPGYAINTDACLDAMNLLARTQAILLDPVYTAKTMAGLVGHIKEGQIGPQDTVIFLHSGGSPALFSDGVALLAELEARGI